MNESQIDIMQEILGEGDIEALKELLEESIRPLIEYRARVEKEMGNKEIAEMYRMEREV